VLFFSLGADTNILFYADGAVGDDFCFFDSVFDDWVALVLQGE
jgi:hypothetical protein